MSDKQTASAWPIAAILLSVTLLAVVAGIGIQLFVLNPTLTGLVERQHTSDLEFCSRSNDARVSNVRSLRGDVHSLKAELALWDAAAAAATPEATAATPPSVSKAFTEDVAAIRLAIHRKEAAVQAAIDAQASVAIHPGSPIVDCHLAYP